MNSIRDISARGVSEEMILTALWASRAVSKSSALDIAGLQKARVSPVRTNNQSLKGKAR